MAVTGNKAPAGRVSGGCGSTTGDGEVKSHDPKSRYVLQKAPTVRKAPRSCGLGRPGARIVSCRLCGSAPTRDNGGADRFPRTGGDSRCRRRAAGDVDG